MLKITGLMLSLVFVAFAPGASAEQSREQFVQVPDSASDAYWESNTGQTARPALVDQAEITHFRATRDARGVTFRFKVKNLTRPAALNVYVGVHRTVNQDENILIANGRDSRVYSGLNSREEAFPCASSRVRFDTVKDVVVLRVPVRCVGPARSYRFDASTEIDVARFYAEDGVRLTPRLPIR